VTEALSGLRVVELSTTMTGAQVGQLLGDFGAEVVMVEPRGGSRLRSQPAFPFWARGKKSIELDLHDPVDLGVATGLAASADVVIETFRPGVADRLGLGYDSLGSQNPRLVHVSVTGFGRTGPYAGTKGYEQLVLAKVGALSAFAGMVTRPGPAYVSVPFCSWSATQAALQGILAALFERERSGLGQWVEASLAQSVGALDPWGWIVHWISRQFPDAFSAAPPVSPDGTPNSSFVFRLLVALTADGRWLQFSQVQPRLFRALMTALGFDWMWDDPRWRTAPEFEDPAMRVEFWGLMLESVRRKTLAEWQEIFASDHNVWAEVFRHGSELLHHPQMVHNGMVAEVADPDLGTVRQPGPLVRASGTPARIERSAPRLDADGAELRAGDRAGPGSPGPAVPSRPAPVPAAQAGRPPLDGVTVLELGTFFAAPFGVTLLTDLGARVIKIEPLGGDPMRSILPFPETGAARVLQGKESVALDMGSDEGRAIIHEIARRSDLVLQSFRAGVAERLGVDDATLRAINPDLVYLNAPGYGVDGPNGHCPAFAPTIGAGAGFAWRNIGTGVREEPGLDLSEIKAGSIRLTAAAGPSFAQADGVAAVGVATALLLGLVARQRGAGGQSMLTTMLSTAAHALSEDMVEYADRGAIATPDVDLLGLHALYRLYETSDGWVFLAAPEEDDWDALCAFAGPGTGLGEDGRFLTPEDRDRHDDALAGELAALFLTKPAADWERGLSAVDVGCVEVAPAPAEANYLDDAFGRAHGFVVDAPHPTFGEHPRLAPLAHFSRSRVTAGGGCLLGQHTESVLTELGHTPARIAELRAAGVIGT